MTLLPPGAVWRPVINFGGPMAESLGLVVHVQDGNGSPWGWFNNPVAQVSSHWWIGVDGSLEAYVDPGLTAWAQAVGNESYHSVETEGLPDEPLTSAQLAALARLFAWGTEVFGWPAQMCDHGGRGMTTHAFYPSGEPDPAWGGHPCPGSVRSAQLPGVIASLNPPAPPPAPSLEEQVDLEVWFSSTQQVLVAASSAGISKIKLDATGDGSALTATTTVGSGKAYPYRGPFSDAFLDSIPTV